MTTSKALLSTLAITVAGTVASGCTLFKRDNAQSAANEAAESVRDQADKAANTAEETAENNAAAVREAGENTADAMGGAVTNNSDTMANTAAGVTNGNVVNGNAVNGNVADTAANRAETGAEARAEGMERAGEQRSGTLRDQAEVLAEAIEKCPVIGLRDSKKYFVASRESGDYLLNASRAGTYSCFVSEAEAKQAGFLATADTGRKAQ